ncbi:MAG: hypothetical protein QXL15_02925 [Candidatus Korarchaeota archaeon]
MALHRHHVLFAMSMHIVIIVALISASVYTGSYQMPIQLVEENFIVEISRRYNLTSGVYKIKVVGDYSKDLNVVAVSGASDDIIVNNVSTIGEISAEVTISLSEDSIIEIDAFSFSGTLYIYKMETIPPEIKDKIVAILALFMILVILIIGIISRDKRHKEYKSKGVCSIPCDASRFHASLIGSFITSMATIFILVMAIRFVPKDAVNQMIEIAISVTILGFLLTLLLIKRGELKDMFSLVSLITAEFPRSKCLDLRGWYYWGEHLFSSNIRLIKMAIKMGLINGKIAKGHLLCEFQYLPQGGDVQCEECGKVVPSRDATLVVIHGRSVFRCLDCNIEISEQIISHSL